MPLNLENLRKSVDKIKSVIDFREDVLVLEQEQQEVLNKTADNFKVLANVIETNIDKLRKDIANIGDDALKEQLEKVIHEFPRNPAFKRIIQKIESGDRISVQETKNFMEDMKEAKVALEQLDTEVEISFEDLIQQFEDSITKLSVTDSEQTENFQGLLGVMENQASVLSKSIVSLGAEDLDEEQLKVMEAQETELKKLNDAIKELNMMGAKGLTEDEDSKIQLRNILSELKDPTFETKIGTSINNVDGALRSLSVDQERLNETLDDLNQTNKSFIGKAGDKLGEGAKSLFQSLMGGILEQAGLGGLADVVGGIGLGDIANLADIKSGFFGRGRRRGAKGPKRGKSGRFGRKGRRRGLFGLGAAVLGGGALLGGGSLLGGDGGGVDTAMGALDVGSGAKDVSNLATKGKAAAGAGKAAKGLGKGTGVVSKLAGLAKGGKIGGGAVGLLKGGARFARFLGPVGAVVTAGLTAYDVYSGVKRASEIFELGEKEATTGQKAAAGLGSALSGLTFGLVGEKTAAKGIHKIGSFISENAEKLGPIGAAFAAVKGVKNAGEMFGLKEGEKATTGQKVSAGVGGALSSLTFGALDPKTATQAIHKLGGWISEGFMKAFKFLTEPLKMVLDLVSNTFSTIQNLVAKISPTLAKLMDFSGFGLASKGATALSGIFGGDKEDKVKSKETSVLTPKMVAPEMGDGGATGVVMNQRSARVTDATAAISKAELGEREMQRAIAQRMDKPVVVTSPKDRSEEIYTDKRSTVDDLGLVLLNTDFFG